MVKVTFTLDDETVARLRRTAARLAKPQSQVVREAVRDYEAKSSKLSDDERRRMLEILDRIVPAGPRPPLTAAVKAELREIRETRRESAKRRAAKAGE